MDHSGNWGLPQPIVFQGFSFQVGFGSFRIPNAKQFNQYVSGRYYDKVFFAPKDTAVMPLIDQCLEDPGEFCLNGGNSDTFWSSYCLSPAAMFNPDVMRNEARGGWQDPWSLPAGFRSPSPSQAVHPSLKTRMLEHHWLQQRRSECNPAFGQSGTYDGCEPYYFNHSYESAPVALWYDGHVESTSVQQAQQADARVRQQTDGDGRRGLWNQTTPFLTDGYFHADGYDFAATSFHILTSDGIRGRDITGGG
jgi:hypothetical protein